MKKDLQYYLDKNYPPEVAEYFATGSKKVIDVVANNDYTITITYNNGVKKLYNVKPLIQPNTVFYFLKDINNFKRVYITSNSIAWDVDPNIDSDKVWNNRVDLCGDACYIYGLTIRSDEDGL